MKNPVAKYLKKNSNFEYTRWTEILFVYRIQFLNINKNYIGNMYIAIWLYIGQLIKNKS